MNLSIYLSIYRFYPTHICYNSQTIYTIYIYLNFYLFIFFKICYVELIYIHYIYQIIIYNKQLLWILFSHDFDVVRFALLIKIIEPPLNHHWTTIEPPLNHFGLLSYTRTTSIESHSRIRESKAMQPLRMICMVSPSRKLPLSIVAPPRQQCV